jgi:hypothetical protein
MNEFDLDGYFTSRGLTNVDTGEFSAQDAPAYDSGEFGSSGDIKKSKLTDARDVKVQALMEAFAAKEQKLRGTTIGRLGLDERGFVGGAVNQAMGAVATGYRMLGEARTAPNTLLNNAREAGIPDSVREADARRLQGKATPEDMELLAQPVDVFNEMDVLDKAQVAINPASAVRTAGMNLMEKLLGTTQGERIEGVRTSREGADKIRKAFDMPKQYVYEGLKDGFKKDLLNTDTKDDLETITSKFGDLFAGEDGSVKAVATEALPALASLMANIGSTAMDNKQASAEFIVENLPQLAVGLLGKGALATTNVAYALDYQNKGILAYQEANNGATPSKQEALVIAAKAASLALAEQAGELGTLKSLGGFAKSVSATPKELLKNTAKRTAEVTDSTIREGITEGYQTAIEDNLEGREVTAENVYTGAAIGAVASSGVTAGPAVLDQAGDTLRTAGKAAADSVNAAKGMEISTASQKVYKEAVKTGKVAALTDPDSIQYAPNEAVRALQERGQKEGLSNKDIAKGQSDAKQVIDQAKERLASVRAVAANDGPAEQAKIQGLIVTTQAALEAATTPEETAAATEKLELLNGLVRTSAQVKENAAKVAKLTETVASAELQYDEWVNSNNKTGTLKATVDLVDSTPDAAVPESVAQSQAATAELVELATSNPELITEEVATRLASNQQNALSTEQRTMFANLARVARVKKEYRDTSDVSFDILQDDPDTGNIGMEAHQRNINSAIAAADKPAAEGALNALTKFAQAQNAKRKAIKTALKTGTEAVPVYLIPEGNGVWTQTTEKPSLEVFNNSNVLTITEKSFKLANQVAKEAELLNAAVQASKASMAVGFSTAPTVITPPVTEEVSAAKDEVKAKPQPKSESKRETPAVVEKKATTPVVKAKASKLQVAKFQELSKRLAKAKTEGKPLTALRSALNQQLETVGFGFSSPVAELYTQLLQADGLVSTDVLQAWVKANGNTGMSGLLDKLLEHPAMAQFKGFSAQTETSTNTKGEAYKPLGMYFEGSKTIGLDLSTLLPFNANSQKFLAEIIVHEVVHAITEGALNSDPQLLSEIKALQGKIEAWLAINPNTLSKAQRTNLDYALRNTSEMLTMGLTNPATIQALNLITLDSGQTALGEFTQRLMEFFRRAMRLTKNQGTALEEVLRISEQFLGSGTIDLGNFDADIVLAEQATLDTTEQLNSENTAFDQLIQSRSEVVLQREQDHTGKTEGVLSVFENAEAVVVNNDNYQSTNLIAAYFKQSAERVGAITSRPLVAIKDFMSALISGQVFAQDFLEDGLTEAQQGLVSHLKAVYPQWQEALQGLLRKDGGNRSQYYYENPTQFLMDLDEATGEVTMDENAMSAAVVSAWTWLIDNAGNPEFRTSDQINRSLPNRGKDQAVTPELAKLLGPLLDRRALLSDRLGQRFVQALGLQAKNGDTPVNELSRLEASAGLMIVGMMQKMGVVEEVSVSKLEVQQASGKTQEEIEAMNPADIIGAETYLKLVATGTRDTRVLNSVAQDFITNAANTGGVLNTLFDVESGVSTPTLKPQSVIQKDTNKGRQGIPKNVLKYLGNVAKMAYTFRDDMVQLTRINSDADTAYVEGLVGIESVDESQVHVINQLSKKAKFDGLRRELDNALGFLKHLAMASEEGENAEFFIRPELWKNHRFGYEGTVLNMQSSKIHRFLAKQGKWLSVVSLNPDVAGEASLDNFKLRVLEGLGSKTDESPDANHLKAFDSVLSNDAYTGAIEALREALYGKKGALTAKQQNAILAGVKAGGANLHSLDSLVAMAHYQQAVSTPGVDSFTTELTAEIDGKTNGPMLSMWLLGGMTPEIAMMGGFYPQAPQGSGYTHYSEYKPGKHDLYQYVSKRISGVLGQLIEGNSTELAPVFASLFNLTGKLVNSLGEVTKDGRNLVKNPLTTLVYGSGMQSTIRGMADGFIDSIYSHIEKINQGKPYGVNKLVGEDAFAQFSDDLNLLMGAAGMKMKEGALDIQPFAKRSPTQAWNVTDVKQAMQTRLSKQQEKALRDVFSKTIGLSTQSVVENDFADYLSARKTITATSNLTYALYEAAKLELRERAVKVLMESGQIAHATNPKTGVKTPRHDLSSKQEKQVLDVIKALEPRINTALSKASKELEAGIYAGKQRRTVRKDSAAYEVKFKFAESSGLGSKSGHGYGVMSEAPGVSVLANSVQSTDGGIMLSIVEQMNSLGIHDAIMVAIKDAGAAGRKINAKTYDLLVSYSLPRESLESLQRTLVGLVANIKADPSNSALIEKLKEQIKPLTEKMDETELAVAENIGLVSYVLAQADGLALQADTRRLTDLANLAYVDQYTIQDGAAEITNKMRASAKTELTRVLALKPDQASIEAATYLDGLLGTVTAGAVQASPEMDLEEDFSLTEDLEPQEDTLAETQESGLASPAPNVNTYSVKEVYAALGQGASRITDAVLSQRLDGLLDTIVDRLQGPYQSLFTAAQSALINVPEDVYRNADAAGALPFNVDIRTSGFYMGDQQAFAAEMVQMVIGESLSLSVNQVDKELVKLFEEARAKVAKTDLDADPVRSEQMWNFVFGIKAGDTSTQYLSRFAALGLTDSKMGALLGFETSRAEDASPESVFGKLMQWFNQLLQVLNEGLGKSYGGQQADQKLQVIVDRMVDLQVSRVAQSQTGKFEAYKEQFEDAVDDATDSVKEKIVALTDSDFFKKSKNPLLRLTGDLATKAVEQRLDEVMVGIEEFHNRTTKGRLGEIAELFNEVRGTTMHNKWGRVKLMLAKYQEKTRKELASNTAAVAMTSFKDGGKHVTQVMREAVTRVLLRADVASLVGPFNLTQIQELLASPTKLAAAIATQEAKITGRFAEYYKNQAKLTGHYLATERAVGENLRMNALSIAMLDGTRFAGKVTEAVGLAAASDVNVLISLHAMAYTTLADRKAVTELMTAEAARGDGGNGVEFALKLHSKLTQESKDRLFQGSERLMVKGYLPEITSPYRETTSVPAAEVEAMKAAGWKDLGVLAQDLNGAARSPMHLMTLDRGMIQRLSGTLSTTSLKSMGTSVREKGLRNTGLIESNKRSAVDTLFKAQPNLDPATDKNTYLVPTSDPSGKTVDYRYLMNQENRDTLMERNNNFDLLLGTLAANTYDKESSVVRNNDIVEMMHAQWTQQRAENAHSYILVSANSADPVVREAYALMPYSTRKHIDSVWGSQGMMIRRDMFNLHFGYRKFSLAEMFNKTPADRNALENILAYTVEHVFGQGPKAALRVRQAEDVWQAAVREVKDFLVVKSGVTLFWNIVSNFSLLYLYGVSPVEMARNHRIAFKGVMEWHKDGAELAQLEAMKQAGYTGNVKDLDHKIAKLKIAIERNPVRGLIEAGLMPSIVEDVNVEDELFTYKTTLGKKVEKVTARIPDVVKTAAKWVYVAHDTPLYQVLNQGTQMSDFVARYTLYQKMTTQRKAPLSHEDAVQFVSEAFVNYDIPSGKGLQYANDMGAVMFTKYYLRIQRVIQHVYRNHPSRAILLMLFDNYFAGMQTIADSSFWSNFGIRMADGALGLPEAFAEGIPADMIGKLFK